MAGSRSARGFTLLLLAALAVPAPAGAAWSATAAGPSGARGGEVAQVAKPTASRVLTTVTVIWTAVSANGASVAYEVRRDGGPIGAGPCSGLVTATSCTDSVAVAATYTVRAVVSNWRGPASPASDPV